MAVKARAIAASTTVAREDIVVFHLSGSIRLERECHRYGAKKTSAV